MGSELPKKTKLSSMLNFDRLLLLMLSKARKRFLVRVSILFTKIGNGQLWIIFSSVMLLHYVPIGFAFYAAILIQLYIQMIVKNLVKRARPYLKYADLEHLYDPPDPYSFPSGHTCAAFTMTFLAKQILPIVWPIFLFMAFVIAFSRLYLVVHYPSDIFGGIFFAYISCKFAIFLTFFVTGISL